MLNDYEIIRNEKDKQTKIYEGLTSLLKLVACSLAVYCAILLIPDALDKIYETRNAAEIESMKIRVVANSNTEADQQLKVEMVENLTPYFQKIQQNELTSVSNDEVYAQLAAYIGQNYPQHDVKINIGDNLMPPKLEATQFYPQDYYNSLVLTIGNGRGENFWCSIFKNVCEAPSEKEQAQEEKVEEEEKEVTFIVWEWLKGLFA